MKINVLSVLRYRSWLVQYCTYMLSIIYIFRYNNKKIHIISTQLQIYKDDVVLRDHITPKVTGCDLVNIN